jgi:tetratricopeptide (TPR) repeat protein
MLFIIKEIYPLTRKSSKIILNRLINQGLFVILLFLLLGTAFLVVSCSQEKNTFVSKNFHNTTARYNAYFLAREKMKEVDDQIWKANVEDYNKILNIYPEINDGTVGAIKPGLEEVIKKASLIPEKHKNSNWLDDSYTIIGKSYLYKKEYKTSLSFFKYVNSKSEDPNARHEALVWLMRTYMDSLDFESAKSVMDYLNSKVKDGEALSEDNLRDFNVAQAAYQQKMENYDPMIPSLETAVDLIKKKDQRARTHFIIGQLYQRQGKDSAALVHYQKATKNNPPYDLLFHSKLYITQVSVKEGKKAERKLDRYFEKLLADKKNEEYRDKIYYEMGNYSLKKKETPEGISNYNKSLRANSKNQPLKGLTYLKLGEIYFENDNFENSKLYYDSTVSVWNNKDKKYKPISNRQKVLAEFVGYQQTVQREDSLQRLAKMPKDKLDAFIDNVIAQEKEEKKKAAEAKEKAKLVAQNQPDKSNPYPNLGTNEESTFTLTNSIAVASGITDFRKTWGNRKLEDNWRRSFKETTMPDEKTEEPTVDKTIEKDSVDKEKAEVVNKDIYYKDIPVTQAQLDSSNKKIEVSLYKIGKIYDQKLDAPQRSIKTYDNLIKRYPQSEFKSEVYYSYYLIYTKLKDEKNAALYRNKLLAEFPTSLYAKLLKNPNYLQDNQLANKQAHEKYKEAFSLYQNGKYKASDSLIKIIKVEFPDNDIDDKLSMLEILNFGQTGSPVTYKERLAEFSETYKSSPLAQKAKEFLAATDEFINSKNQQGEALTEAYVKFSQDLNKPHVLVIVLPKNVPSGKSSKEFESFSKSNQEKSNLKVQHYSFTDTSYIVTISGFEEKFPAQVFINKLKDEKSFFQKNGYIDRPVFIISNPNYQLFVESKNLAGYLKFYKENY